MHNDIIHGVQIDSFLSDRIYRIIWIFLFSPLPDEGEKTQSRLSAGDSLYVGYLLCFRILFCSLLPCSTMTFSLGEGLRFLPFFRKGKKYFKYPVNPVKTNSHDFKKPKERGI
jgi:hypothetical protein